MSINYRTTEDEKVMDIIWDNFFGKGVTREENITITDIEKELKVTKKLQEEWRNLSPKGRRFGLNKGLGSRYRRKISQLKYLLKVINKGI